MYTVNLSELSSSSRSGSTQHKMDHDRLYTDLALGSCISLGLRVEGHWIFSRSRFAAKPSLQTQPWFCTLANCLSLCDASGESKETSLQRRPHHVDQQNHCGAQRLGQWQLSDSGQGHKWGRWRRGQRTHPHSQIKWVWCVFCFPCLWSLHPWPLIESKRKFNNLKSTFDWVSLHPSPATCNRLLVYFSPRARNATFLEMRAWCHPSLPLGYYSLLTGCTALLHIKQLCVLPSGLSAKLLGGSVCCSPLWCDTNFIFSGCLNSLSCWKPVIM